MMMMMIMMIMMTNSNTPRHASSKRDVRLQYQPRLDYDPPEDDQRDAVHLKP